MDANRLKAIKEYLKGKGVHAITIDYRNVRNCCSSYRSPFIKLGEPKQRAGYYTYTYEGITLYLNHALTYNQMLVDRLLSQLIIK